MNRADLHRLSNVRMREARILFASEEYRGAYYLAGYAIECALKACFARGVKRYDFPDKDGAGKIFTHNFGELVRFSNLGGELDRAKKANSKFSAGWALVCQWSPDSRYKAWTKNDAQDMLDAIARRRDGVLPWISDTGNAQHKGRNPSFGGPGRGSDPARRRPPDGFVRSRRLAICSFIPLPRSTSSSQGL